MLLDLGVIVIILVRLNDLWCNMWRMFWFFVKNYLCCKLYDEFVCVILFKCDVVNRNDVINELNSGVMRWSVLRGLWWMVI